MQNMSKHNWCGALVLVIALWWVSPMPVHAAPFTAVVEYDTATPVGCCSPYTFGYQFSTSVPFNIDALAYWVDGFGNNHQVGLWDSGGTLLVSTTVLNTDPIQGHFQYHSIPNFSLVPGAYTIGGEYLGGITTIPVNAVGVVTVPGFTWTTDAYIQGADLNYPTNSQGGGCGQNCFLTVGFSVPESSTLLLLGSGLLGLAAWRWKHAA